MYQEKVADLILETTYNYIQKNKLEKIIKDAGNAIWQIKIILKH